MDKENSWLGNDLEKQFLKEFLSFKNKCTNYTNSIIIL